MERLRRRFFKLKNSKKILDAKKIDEDEIYLEPLYDETSTITIHIDAIAEEILNIAKKSVRYEEDKVKIEFLLSFF